MGGGARQEGLEGGGAILGDLMEEGLHWRDLREAAVGLGAEASGAPCTAGKLF